MDEMDYTMQASVHPVPLPGWWIQQIPGSHRPTPPSFPRHPSDPSPPTSHSANRGYDPVHAASNSNHAMNNQNRTSQESGQGNSGNAGNNMNNSGGNRQDGHPSTGHAHHYGGNGTNSNNNNNANNGNVTAPTTGVSTSSVSVGNTVTSGAGTNTWFPAQSTTASWPLPSLAFQVQPSVPYFPPPGSMAELYGLNGGSSANSGRGPGAQPAANPVSSADADTLMGNTETQGGSSAATAATATPRVGGLDSGPIQADWTPQQGPSRSAFPPVPPPPPPGLSSIEAGYLDRFTSSHNHPTFSNINPLGQVLPDPGHWGSRHISHATSVNNSNQHHTNGPPPGHRRQPSHQSSQPVLPATATSSAGSHIRLPAPDPHSRLAPYRPSSMSIPTEGGNDLFHALQLPQGPPNPPGPQASASSADRPSRQRSGSGLTNTAAPLPDNQSRTGSATTSASAPTSVSVSNTGPPFVGHSTSFSRGPAYPEMRTEMRDFMVRALHRSDSVSDDDMDFPDEIPTRRLVDEERAAQLLRARQVARGQSTKKVASRKAIESLEPVNVADLPETDRSSTSYFVKWSNSMRGIVAPGHGKQRIDDRLLRKIQATRDEGPDTAPCTSDSHHRERLHKAANAHRVKGSPASDGDNAYRSADTSQMSSTPQQPPAPSYTSEPAPPWMQHGEASFAFEPSNRDPAFPDQIPGTRGPAQGQPSILAQRDQPLASTYSGETPFPGSSTFPLTGTGRQWPE
ncbi:hypothetical protein NEUTE1DRAFT_126782 [Neurospora tetrasperma FGSC 2508]|uniref:Uncharacterized protein n=1 Tax=Neurospora tetrasperma (strain FGSC 2508 / ATCC MYA-4615 / P0657) TaxID=510951 RepID=F8N443_NEUT8|nr:uncharacterized protein NEUTE1DRAFT_126782 [Neurospora tetrasperma FGSC 2508]EGO53486.1 hypothetical protein NEUTE1DRAFT_126782 [Neurospora tetrasperma FGSC 2508]